MSEEKQQEEKQQEEAEQAGEPDATESRLQLIGAVLIFQLKLIADGMRDVILVPVSFFALVAGLIAGGRHPSRYFDRLLELGRESERFINLFGGHAGHGTSDEVIDPIKNRVIKEAHLHLSTQRAAGKPGRTSAGDDRTPPPGAL